MTPNDEASAELPNDPPLRTGPLLPAERAALLAVGVDPNEKPQNGTATGSWPTEAIPDTWGALDAYARGDLDAQQVTGFFATPQPDLEHEDGSAMTPND